MVRGFPKGGQAVLSQDVKNESYMCAEMKNEIRLLEDHITRCWAPAFYTPCFDKLEVRVREEGREEE